jgi:hypothetical protein
MLIEHSSDNQFGDVDLVLGRRYRRPLFLRRFGRRWAALIYLQMGKVGIEAVCQGLWLVIVVQLSAGHHYCLFTGILNSSPEAPPAA